LTRESILINKDEMKINNRTGIYSLFISLLIVSVTILLSVASKPAEENRLPDPAGEKAQQYDAEKYLSPAALEVIEGKEILIIAQQTGRRIDFFDAKRCEIKHSISLKHAPGGMCLSRDGKRLFVTAGRAEGVLYTINVHRHRVHSVTGIGHSPCSPVMVGKNTVAFCNRFSGQVGFMDVQSGEILQAIHTGREPISIDFDEKRSMLVVAHHLPDDSSTAVAVSAEIGFIDTDNMKLVKQISMRNGSTSLKQIRIAPDGRYAVVSHLLARFNVPTSQLEQAWENTNAISLIDMEKQELYQTVLLDELHRGYANPWGIAFNQSGTKLIVAQAGTGNLSFIDFPELVEKINQYPADGGNYDDIENPANILSYINDCRKITELKGDGPRSLAVDRNRLYVGQYFSDAVEIVQLDHIGQSSHFIPLNHTGPDLVRKGEMLFNSGKICFENWQSCASCHPEGRMDGLNWDLLNDGIGNPKNTHTLLYSHETPAVMSTGVRAKAEVAVRAGIKYILFSEVREEEALAIDAFLKNMRPLPSPYLIGGELSGPAEKGKLIFQKANCSQCHHGPCLTDQKLHDVGTTSKYDLQLNEKDQIVPQKEYDTPSLVELYRTAPYLHDGRYCTLEELLNECSHGHIRETLDKLSDQEIAQFITYLKSL